MSMNRALVTIQGHVGRDPELKFTKGGKAVAKFPVAVTDRVKEGETWVDGTTTWFDIVAWGNLAEDAAEGVGKGDVVLVAGRLRRDDWTGDDKVVRTRLEVSADQIGVSFRSKRRGPRTITEAQAAPF